MFRLPARNRFDEGRDFDIRICYFLSVVALVFIAGGIYDDPYIDQTAGLRGTIRDHLTEEKVSEIPILREIYLRNRVETTC